MIILISIDLSAWDPYDITLICLVQNDVESVTLWFNWKIFEGRLQTRASLLRRAMHAEYEMLLSFLLPVRNIRRGVALGPNGTVAFVDLLFFHLEPLF